MSLNELDSATVKVSTEDGNVVLDCAGGEPFGLAEADSGRSTPTAAETRSAGTSQPTEFPEVGATEVWELYNFTEDAHPIHIHEITFEAVNRQPFDGGPQSPGELGARSQGHGDRLPGRDRRVKAPSTALASSSGTATSSSTRTTR